MPDAIASLNAALEGRYHLERELGAGGMATVYLAADLRHERRVALKVLRPELAAVVGADRFLAEIKTTANLHHPHILPLFDSGQAGGFLFYVMPHVDGETLRDRLEREHQLPVDEAVTIATRVAGALRAAHEHGVIHRDVKPANVLLARGEPLVADFGIALAVGSAGGGRLTETGLSLGTPHYMSPEQATGDASVGPAVDIYALGCVLYEMLVGEPPYTGSTPQAVLGKIITEPAPRISKARATVPSNVEAAVAKALEKIPADRFRSAADFAAALADPGFGYRPGRAAPPGSRAGTSWKTASMGLAAALVASLAWTFAKGLGPTSAGPTAAHLQIALPDGVTLPIQDDYPVLAVSPDGSTLAFVGERDGVRRLYVRGLTDGASRPIQGTEGALQPFFSPDGRWIAYASGDDIYRVPVAGGVPVAMHQHSGEGVGRGVTWAQGEVLVAGISANSGLSVGVVQEDRQVLREEWDSLTAPGQPTAWPSAVPGVRDVVYGRVGPGPEGSDIGLVSLDTGAETVLVNGATTPRVSSTGHLLFARGSVLFSTEYDLAGRRVSGAEREALSGVAMSGPGVSQYGEGGGVLAYVPGTRLSGEMELVWVDRAGEVLGVPHAGRVYESPRIAPDGRQVAVTITEGANLDVHLLDLGRGTLQPLTRHPGEDFEAQWRPDGSGIALSSEVGEDRGEAGPAAAWIPELGGPTLQLVFSPEEGAWDNPTGWTPDGRSVVVTVRRPGSSSDVAMYSVEAEDPELVPLVTSPANEAGARVSPDARWIAYVSDETGREEIWIRPFPGPGVAQPLSAAGGTEPVWSGDSREVFFRSGLDVMVVAVPADPNGVFGAPALLFSGDFEPNLFGGRSANYDVSRDGQRFLMVRRSVRVRPRVIDVVLDWPTVLLGPDDPRSGG